MRVLLACTLFLLAAPLFAALGTVSYVAVPGSVRIEVQPEMFTKPVNATGLVSPIARIARIAVQDDTWAVALDADTAQGTRFTRLRLDFTGAGNFTPDNALELQQQQGQADSYYCMKPKDFSIQVGSRTLPVSFRASCYAVNNKPNLTLFVGCAAQATCACGDKTFIVRILDSNGNWHFGDPNPAPKFPLRGDVAAGDMVTVGNSSGYYGQPIGVDGHWYCVAITPDESTITVTPFTGPLGTVAVKADRWFGTFVGAKYIVDLTGTAQPQTIPVDNYHLVSFREMPVGNSGTPQLMVNDYEGQGKVFAVKADTTVPINLGTAVSARVDVQQNGRNLTFSLTALNSIGSPFYQLGNNVPFVVTDKQGNKVYENTFESG